MAAAEYADAAQLLKPLASAQPDDLSVRMALADTLSRLQDTGDRQAAANEADWLKDRIPPSDVGQQLALLRIWQRIGRMDEARALATRLLDRFPQDSDVLLHAARLERANRNYAQAMVFFRSALMLETRGKDTPPTATTPDSQAPVPVDSDQPLALQQSYTLSVPADPAVVAKIQGEIDAIEARRQPRIEAGHQALSKRSTDGISSLPAGSDLWWRGCRVATTGTTSCTWIGCSWMRVIFPLTVRTCSPTGRWRRYRLGRPLPPSDANAARAPTWGLATLATTSSGTSEPPGWVFR